MSRSGRTGKSSGPPSSLPSFSSLMISSRFSVWRTKFVISAIFPGPCGDRMTDQRSCGNTQSISGTQQTHGQILNVPNQHMVIRKFRSRLLVKHVTSAACERSFDKHAYASASLGAGLYFFFAFGIDAQRPGTAINDLWADDNFLHTLQARQLVHSI